VIWLLVIVEAGALLILLAIAVGKSLHMRDLEQQIHRLAIRAETAESWAERWQQLAEAAAEETEQVATKHAQLQQLYARRTRELLAANWPIVIEYRKWAKR
jgi:hypothetical protein